MAKFLHVDRRYLAFKKEKKIPKHASSKLSPLLPDRSGILSLMRQFVRKDRTWGHMCGQLRSPFLIWHHTFSKQPKRVEILCLERAEGVMDAASLPSRRGVIRKFCGLSECEWGVNLCLHWIKFLAWAFSWDTHWDFANRNLKNKSLRNVRTCSNRSQNKII